MIFNVLIVDVKYNFAAHCFIEYVCWPRRMNDFIIDVCCSIKFFFSFQSNILLEDLTKELCQEEISVFDFLSIISFKATPPPKIDFWLRIIQMSWNFEGMLGI